jgi:hypothetical protein
MNAELANLLVEAGVDGRLDWREIVTLYNYAPIPAPPLQVDISGWMRGFNLVVLRKGRPETFVKCRPASDAVLDRESAIRIALAGDRPGKLSISPVRQARSARIAVQVSPFLRGPTYGQIVATQKSEQYVQTLASVLQSAAELAAVAQRDCELLKQPTPTVSVPALANDALAEVASLASLDAAQQAALAEVVLEAGEVPSIPQHGDFWWQNLIMVDEQLYAIDFDSYGDIRVPLFDDLTLMVTTMAVRAGGTVEGLTRLTSAEPEARGCHRILAERARVDGVALSKLDGLLVYYLANMAATVHRRGGLAFSGPHIAAARYAAERLARGERGLLSVR